MAGLDGEDDGNTSDGEAGRVFEGMVRTTHPHFFCSFIYIYLFLSCRLPPLVWGCTVDAVLCALKTMRPTEPQLEKLTGFQIRGLASLLGFPRALKGHIKAELPTVVLVALDDHCEGEIPEHVWRIGRTQSDKDSLASMRQRVVVVASELSEEAMGTVKRSTTTKGGASHSSPNPMGSSDKPLPQRRCVGTVASEVCPNGVGRL